MLSIKTMRNYLSSDAENAYCFRSNCTQTLSDSELAGEMADYNSTFTEADFTGMLSVLNTVIIKFLAKGYCVELPFCSIRPTATGTCSSIQGSFSPGSGNNQINYILSMTSAARSEIYSKLEYKQITPESSGDAKIYSVLAILEDASESSVLSVSAGSILRIRGKNLSFDFSDSRQGITLYGTDSEGNAVEAKVTKYVRSGSNVLDFLLPSDIVSGSYTLSLTTKPGVNRYSDTSCDSVITVS